MTLPAENREREIEEACCYSILCVSRLLFLINEHFVCGENKMHNKMAEYMYKFVCREMDFGTSEKRKM